MLWLNNDFGIVFAEMHGRKTWIVFFQIALYIMVGDYQNFRCTKSSVNLAPFHGTPPTSGYIKDCNESRPSINYSVSIPGSFNFQGIRYKGETIQECEEKLPTKIRKGEKIIILKSATYWLEGVLCIFFHERKGTSTHRLKSAVW